MMMKKIKTTTKIMSLVLLCAAFVPLAANWTPLVKVTSVQTNPKGNLNVYTEDVGNSQCDEGTGSKFQLIKPATDQHNVGSKMAHSTALAALLSGRDVKITYTYNSGAEKCYIDFIQIY